MEVCGVVKYLRKKKKDKSLAGSRTGERKLKAESGKTRSLKDCLRWRSPRLCGRKKEYFRAEPQSTLSKN